MQVSSVLKTAKFILVILEKYNLINNVDKHLLNNH